MQKSSAPLLESVAQVERALNMYQMEAIHEIAAELGVRFEPKSKKAEQIRAIASFVSSATCARQLASKLSPEQWGILRLERLRTEPTWLPSLRDRLAATGLTTEESERQLVDLLRKAVLIPVSPSGWGRFTFENVGKQMRQFFVAAPSRLVDLALEQPPAPLHVVTASEPPRVERADIGALQREVFLTLMTIGRDGIRLTSKDLPHRTDLAKLAQALAAGPVSTTKGKGNKKSTSTAGTLPPSRLWFILGLLHYSPLVSRDGEKYELTQEGQSYLKSPPSKQAEALHDAWLRSPWSELHRIPSLVISGSEAEWHWAAPTSFFAASHVPDMPALRRARQVIESTLQALLADGPRESWLDLSAFVQTLRRVEPELLIPFGRLDGYYNQYGYGYSSGYQDATTYYVGIGRRGERGNAALLRRGEDWLEVEGNYIANVIAEPLHWLGLADVGRDEQGAPIAFRLTPLGRHILLGESLPEPSASAGPRLVVQPSFEVIVLDASQSLDLVASIEEFAERQTLDRAAVYRLSRESIVGGLRRGLAGEKIVGLLEAASSAPLPQNVAYSIREWVHQYERFHLQEGMTLLEADDEAQLDRWYQDQRTSPFLGKRLGPTTAAVPDQSIDALLAALRQMGRPAPTVDYSMPLKQRIHFDDALTFTVTGRGDDMYQRHRFGTYAELVSREAKSATYRITREAAERARALKVPVGYFILYLQRYVDGRLDPDTLLHLYGWSGEVGSMNTADVVAVEAPERLTWPELAMIPSIACCEPSFVSPRLAMVPQAKLDDLRRALAERGIALEGGLKLPTVQGVSGSTTPATPPSRGPTQTPRASRKPEVPRDKIAELRRMIREEQWIGLRTLDEKGQTVILRVRPVDFYREGGSYLLDALCSECDEVHTFELADLAPLISE